jgi:hypothetical protein
MFSRVMGLLTAKPSTRYRETGMRLLIAAGVLIASTPAWADPARFGLACAMTETSSAYDGSVPVAHATYPDLDVHLSIDLAEGIWMARLSNSKQAEWGTVMPLRATKTNLVLRDSELGYDRIDRRSGLYKSWGKLGKTTIFTTYQCRRVAYTAMPTPKF